jgi:hypothetical protein
MDRQTHQNLTSLSCVFGIIPEVRQIPREKFSIENSLPWFPSFGVEIGD